MTHAQALAETIERLPPARRAEVEQFVAFVALRERIMQSVAQGGAHDDDEIGRDLDAAEAAWPGSSI